VHVVGGYGGDAELVSQQVQGAEAGPRVGQQLVLQLDEEAAAEDVAENRGRPGGARLVAGQKARPHLAAAAAAERDEVAAVLGHGSEAGHGRLAGVLQVRGCDDATEVAPALVVAGEQDEMMAAGSGCAAGGRRHRGGALEPGCGRRA
jgi:hypothetical protein